MTPLLSFSTAVPAASIELAGDAGAFRLRAAAPERQREPAARSIQGQGSIDHRSPGRPDPRGLRKHAGRLSARAHGKASRAGEHQPAALFPRARAPDHARGRRAGLRVAKLRELRQDKSRKSESPPSELPPSWGEHLLPPPLHCVPPPSGRRENGGRRRQVGPTLPGISAGRMVLGPASRTNTQEGE